MENRSTRHHLGHDSVSKVIFKIKVTGKVKTIMYIDKGFKKENSGKYTITWNLGKCFYIKVTLCFEENIYSWIMTNELSVSKVFYIWVN